MYLQEVVKQAIAINPEFLYEEATKNYKAIFSGKWAKNYENNFCRKLKQIN